MRLTLVLVASVLLLGSVLGQDSSEDSAVPKRVLKKYRVRRPVIVDDQGNVVRAGPRLRRVRVKNPRPTLETAAVIASTPQIVSSTTQASVPVGVAPQPQIIRQRQPSSNSLEASPAPRVRARPQPQVQAQPQAQAQPQRQAERQHQTLVPQPQQQVVQQQPQPRQQPQPLFYEDQEVVEPVRTVPTYRQATSSANREALLANVNYKTRGGTANAVGDDENLKKVGTTRNYSRINEDGSFTFGYEAHDGSFKEETRGVDCVVRGKYGYIDPEGIRREFEYVSGNPCDPNDPNKGEESLEDDEIEGGAPPPRALLRQRVRPTEISENNIQQGLQQISEERLPEDQLANFVRPVQRQRVNRPVGQQNQGQLIRQRVRITTPPPPTYNPSTEQPALIIRQRPLSAGRPLYQEPSQSLESDRSNSGRAFNFDSELQRINSISRPASQPQPLYEQAFRQVQQQPSRQIFGNSAFQRELQQHEDQHNNQEEAPRARPNPTVASAITNPNFGRYRTELVYDQQNGQYNSVFVQSNPNTEQEFQLTQKLRAFVQPTPDRPQSHTTPTQGGFTSIQQFGQPQVQYHHSGAQYQPQRQPQQPQPTQAYNNQPQQTPQDPTQINQFLARHAYRVHQDQTHQTQPQVSVNNLQFIPPHLRPGAHQTAEIQQQEVREINLPSPSRQPQPQILSANSAAAGSQASTGQIDAFLRALNISI